MIDLTASIPTPINKLSLVAGIADKVFGGGVTDRDLQALSLLALLRMVEGQKGTANPGLGALAVSVQEAVSLIVELDTPPVDPEPEAE